MDDKLFEDKKFDDSMFEDKKFDDSLFEDTPISAQEEQAPAESNPLAPVERTIMGGAAGYTGGHLLNAVGRGAANVTDKIVNTGALTPEQVKHITDNADTYKKAPALEDMLNQFRDLGRNTRQRGFDMAEQAKASLKGAPDLSPEEFFKALGRTAEQPKFSAPVAPGALEGIQEAKMSQVRPQIDAQVTNSKRLEQQLSQLQSQQFQDDYSPRISELESSIAAQPEYNVPFEAREKERTVVTDRKAQRLDEKIARLEKKQGEALERALERKEDFQLGRSAKEERIGTVQANKEMTKLEQMQAELEQLKAERIAAQEKFAAKQAKDIEKTKFNKSKIDTSVQEKAKKVASSAQADFEKNVLRTPKEIRNTNPEFFNQRTLDPDFAKALDQAAERARNVESLSTERVAEGILPLLRDKANFAQTGASAADKFNTDISEGLRQYLGEKFPEYDAGMKASSEAIKAEEQFGKFGLKADDQGVMDFPEGKRQQLAGIASADSSKFIDERANLQQLVQSLKEQGLVQDSDRFLADLKNAAIKQGVKETDILRMTGYDVANSLKGSPSSIIKPLMDTYRTKAQERVALSKGQGGLLNTAGKAADVVGKALPGILGAGGAIMGAMSAAQAGELSPEEATLTGALDVINPTPTDPTQGLVEAKKAIKQGVAEGESPFLEANIDPNSPTGVTQSSPLMDKALIAGAKGLVSPIPALAGAAKDVAESFGTSQSEQARSRMEQQMNALNTLKDEPKKKSNDFLNFVNKNPESLQQLAETLSSGAGASYSAPLQKAANSDERTRTAILFGLYQQPAFRSLIGGEGSLISDNIPGVKKSDK